MTELFHFRGFDIPVDLAKRTGGGPATFEQISNHHIGMFQEYVGLKPDDQIIEMGCGIGRDAIPLTKLLSPKGSYLGTEICRESVKWCTDNITSRYPNFSFEYHDIYNTLYNPTGKLQTTDIRLPKADGCIDLIFLESVFTHIFEDEIDHYLKEFRRVIKPSGRIVATMLVVNQAMLDSLHNDTKKGRWLTFKNPHTKGCFINSLTEPRQAVAYLEQTIELMLERAAWELAHPIVWGKWSGLRSDANPRNPGQDVLILKRKAS